MTLSSALERPLQAELMDGTGLPLLETEHALSDLDRVHRTLFGFNASCRALIPRLARGPKCQVLIDLGTGSGQIARKLRHVALRRGILLRTIGVDRKLSHLLFGRRLDGSSLRVVADVEALPFRRNSTDWTFSNLLLHHFVDRQNQAILAEMQRVARRGAVVVDLRQALCARGLIRLLFPLLRVGPVATHDGKLSTDQAWCLDEVQRLTSLMPVEELRRRFPFRFSLVLGTGKSPEILGSPDQVISRQAGSSPKPSAS